MDTVSKTGFHMSPNSRRYNMRTAHSIQYKIPAIFSLMQGRWYCLYEVESILLNFWNQKRYDVSKERFIQEHI